MSDRDFLDLGRFPGNVCHAFDASNSPQRLGDKGIVARAESLA
jgi:hypothetical protein